MPSYLYHFFGLWSFFASLVCDHLSLLWSVVILLFFSLWSFFSSLVCDHLSLLSLVCDHLSFLWPVVIFLFFGLWSFFFSLTCGHSSPFWPVAIFASLACGHSFLLPLSILFHFICWNIYNDDILFAVRFIMKTSYLLGYS